MGILLRLFGGPVFSLLGGPVARIVGVLGIFLGSILGFSNHRVEQELARAQNEADLKTERIQLDLNGRVLELQTTIDDLTERNGRLKSSLEGIANASIGDCTVDPDLLERLSAIR